jgi:hypothetical protein
MLFIETCSGGRSVGIVRWRTKDRGLIETCSSESFMRPAEPVHPQPAQHDSEPQHSSQQSQSIALRRWGSAGLMVPLAVHRGVGKAWESGRLVFMRQEDAGPLGRWKGEGHTKREL